MTSSERGRKVLLEIQGQKYLDENDADTSPIHREIRRYVEEWAYGEIWARPGLDIKTRCIITFALSASAHRPLEFKRHIAGALNMGWTLEELTEALLHTIPYSGFPPAVASGRILQEVAEARGLAQASGK